MANLTLSLDDEVLRRARMRALEQGTSVNAVVRDYLTAYAGMGEVELGTRRFLELARASAAGSGSGGRRWRRDELHER